MRAIYGIGILLSCLFGSAFAETAVQPVVKKIKPIWLDAHLKTLQQEPKIKKPVNFVFDNNIWLPSDEYINGSQWLALNCLLEKCTLEPATLVVKKESWQGHYDDKPTIGQKLRFKKNNDTKGKVIAWFALPSQLVWLQEGDVQTYYSIVQPLKNPNNQGTLEALVVFPNGGQSTLVPMAFKAKKFVDEDERYLFYDEVFLQLRSDTKRQFLLGTLGSCEGVVPVGSRFYLQWAGDLDRDGKADYLVSFIDADGPVHLYLSSYAVKDQLVGLAGIHDSPPYGGECDGGGWSFDSEQD